jgi:hypothetical protein
MSMTIQETRHLLLPLRTVLDALMHFDKRANAGLLRGDIVQAEVELGGVQGDGLEIAVRSAEDNIIEWHRFNRTELGAAIISYCRAKRIPLPKTGAKSLSFTDTGIMFSIANQVSVAPKAALRPEPRRCAKGYEPDALEPKTRLNTQV